jgi:hypothetical protein
MARATSRYAAIVTVVLATGIAAQDRTLPRVPLDVEFSVPVEGEADVRLDTVIRVKFSRDADAASLDNHIRLSYSREESAERGESQPPAITFTTSYSSKTQVLVITPKQPLERFRQVQLTLLAGIVGRDGSVLKPWNLRFRTGGS